MSLFNPTVFIGGVDVTSDVRGIDGANAVVIIWGRRDTAGTTAPRRCTFQLNDPTGKYNRENPYSPFFGALGLSYEVLVFCGDTRFTGELTSMTPSWDMPNGEDTVVDVIASSPRNRLKQGERPIKSPATRALSSSDSQSTMITWWPLEEDTGATLVTSPLGAAAGSMATSGVIEFGAYATSPATARMLTFGTLGRLHVAMPSYVDTGELKICGFFFMPSGTPSNTHILRAYLNWGSATAKFIDVIYPTTGTGQLQVIAYGPTGTIIDSGSVIDYTISVLNQHFFLSLQLVQVGADIEYTLLITPPINDGVLITETLSGVTMGVATQIVVAPDNCEGISFGQLIVGNDVFGFGDLMNQTFGGAIGLHGFKGEPVDRAIDRLYAEEGLVALLDAVSIVGTPIGEAMGVQPSDKLTSIVDRLVELDGGIFTDVRDLAWQRYAPRYSLYSQAPAAWLTTAHLNGKLRPKDDNFGTTNDVTANRDGGGNSRYAIDIADGYHGTTADPLSDPTGIGVYETAPQYNAESDSQLPALAQWAAHQGSWLEKRVSQIQIDLSRTALLNDAVTTAAVKNVREGSLITIDTSTRWLAGNRQVPPDAYELLVQGGQEELSQCVWRFTFNTTPGRAWEVAQVDTAGSALVAPITAVTGSDTWRLATSLGPEWDITRVPYRIQCGGEAVNVVVMTTDTPAFIATGATASGNNGASVVPALPAGITADVGQSLYLFAAVRNSGTGVPNTPAGWTPKAVFGNIGLYHRYYATGVTAPTVSFTGGAAGDDTQAVIWAFSGLSGELACGPRSLPVAATLLNGSAANVAYPALKVNRDGGVIFILGWKQDDNAGVATLAGVDGELFDSSTATGNDMSIFGDYDIYTTATDVAAGSFTVSGGAAAISRGIVVAFRPTQHATVTRKQNNVNVAASIGAAVKGWRMGVNGL